MIDTKKEQERSALHSTIWQIANDLRGNVDGWDFKQYVLGILFYRFISENLCSYVNKKQKEAGKFDFDYAEMNDSDAELGRNDILEEKGFFIPPSELFENVRKLAVNDVNLNETLETVLKNIEASAAGTESESDLKGLFDDLDVNSNKLGTTVAKRNEKLAKLLNAIGDLPIGNFDNNSIDLFGDTYEYLMTMYAANAGRSGGEFFTPQEVSELLARITVAGKREVNKVYDPACGSGSLLLKFAKVLGKENVRQGFYGQEVNITTYNLCRINMFLHDINYEQFEIAQGDTLTEPQHRDIESFDAIVSNPPYSINWDGDANPLLINDDRFTPAGVLAPKSRADFAFIMHILSSLSTTGTAAIVSFPGAMYRKGVEQKIRKYLVDNNYVDTVIQLPPNLFFGAAIATCILVIKKSKTDNKVLFIDATNEFVRAPKKNKLNLDHINKILDCYVCRETREHFSRLVDQNEIAGKDYNLFVNNYVVREDTREVIDIEMLNFEIEDFVARQSKFRSQICSFISDKNGDANRIDEFIAQRTLKSVEFKELQEIFEIRNGYTPSKSNKNYWIDGTVPWFRMDDIRKNGTILSESLLHVTEEAVKGGRPFPANSIIVSTSATIGKHALITVPFIANQRFASLSLKPEFAAQLDIRFIYYYCFVLDTWCRENTTTSSFASVNMAGFKRFKFPIPPISIQREIVYILDNLTVSFTNLEAELKVELEARQKQYELYRNQLLTFMEDT